MKNQNTKTKLPKYNNNYEVFYNVHKDEKTFEKKVVVSAENEKHAMKRFLRWKKGVEPKDVSLLHKKVEAPTLGDAFPELQKIAVAS